MKCPNQRGVPISGILNRNVLLYVGTIQSGGEGSASGGSSGAVSTSAADGETLLSESLSEYGKHP